MKVATVRLPDKIKKRLEIKAKLEHRTVSEQIKKYIHDGILCEENPDLPLSVIRETLAAKEEIKAGFGKEYQFGIIK